jgi:predicted nucleic acid-binding protein
VKWLLPGESYQENADRLKEDIKYSKTEMFAPSFMTQEVAYALWAAVKLGRITQEDAQKALSNSDELQINLYDFNWKEASGELAIAFRLDLTIYDAAYLFLSEKMNTQLITADDKMYKKAKGHFKVLHLKDYV